MNCEELKKVIEKHGFKVKNVFEEQQKCLIDFVHPKIEVESKVEGFKGKFLPSYFWSGVSFDKKRKFLNTTVRSKVEGFKELYLDYCCEKENDECIQLCRPHVNMQDKILSVEATFFKNPIKKFDRLLEEMR